MSLPRVVIIGGGAAGFFAAIAAAEQGAEVTVLEKTSRFLDKVRISGGGRCNVTHACFDPREFAARYPRGGRALLGPFQKFSARDTVAWFESRGVKLKTEADGRMFPVTDSSQTIIDCLMGAAQKAGVRLGLNCGVQSVAKLAGGGFEVALRRSAPVPGRSNFQASVRSEIGESNRLGDVAAPGDGRAPERTGEANLRRAGSETGVPEEIYCDPLNPQPSTLNRAGAVPGVPGRAGEPNLRRAVPEAGVPEEIYCDPLNPQPSTLNRAVPGAPGERIRCDRVLLATGGCRGAAAGGLAVSLGHTLAAPVPSLFTFQIESPWLRSLAGVSAGAEISVAAAKLRERGPLLVTHWGLSGPAVLKISAWGARVLHDLDYQFPLLVNWLPEANAEKLVREFQARRESAGAKLIVNAPLSPLTARLWEQLVLAAGIARETRWSALTRTQSHALAQQLMRTEFVVTGKSLNKDEFVTCGGVKLGEVNFRTMESKLCPGLYFAGELLDIDGLTGGFNFQAAWTTGFIAGRAMAA